MIEVGNGPLFLIVTRRAATLFGKWRGELCAQVGLVVVFVTGQASGHLKIGPRIFCRSRAVWNMTRLTAQSRVATLQGKPGVSRVIELGRLPALARRVTGAALLLGIVTGKKVNIIGLMTGLAAVGSAEVPR